MHSHPFGTELEVPKEKKRIRSIYLFSFWQGGLGRDREILPDRKLGLFRRFLGDAETLRVILPQTR